MAHGNLTKYAIALEEEYGQRIFKNWTGSTKPRR
jgi:hypothetical protein